ncbi:hypothetical protein Sjap_023825 [Stephania japonica]|uniref:Rhodanese-like domain-containing protein 4, chloroplastic n=1 Tax=Stephania japonica TaxID=461633 RepID=A0AAP0EHL5_9MAGN
MEVLNAASLNPASVLRDRRAEPKKTTSSFQPKFAKFAKSACFDEYPLSLSDKLSKKISGGALILSSVLNCVGAAKAITYEEALEQTVSGSSSGGGFNVDIDIGGIVDSVVSFGTENPAVVIGGVTILVVPLLLSQIFKKPKAWGVESARNAYAKLGEDGDAQLLDIRAPVDFREVGSPDLRGLRKKAVSISYKGDDKLGFLKKLRVKFKDPGNTTLFILDKFNGNSELVAELVTLNGFKAAYAIRDGAEGPRGWLKSELPWVKKALNFDLGALTDIFSEIGDGSDSLPVTIGLAAATGLGLLAFTEIETVLELLGSAALIQFFSSKLLFAENRKKTLAQVEEFLNTKVAPQELADDMKQIGKALLPVTLDKKALPGPEEGTTNTAVPDNTVQKASDETPSEINSAPRAEVKEESLSPYPYYPDFKPPSSPSPSPP